jgi:hypothetical protein
MITAGYLGAQHNPLSTAEMGGVVVLGFVGFGFVFGIFVVYASLGTVKTEEE